MHHHERAFSFGDVAAEILADHIGITFYVEKIVLNLERKPGIQSIIAQRFDLSLGSAADDCTDGQRHRTRIMGGLMGRHDKVIFRRNVVAIIARPAKIEGLALYGSPGHIDQLSDDANLHGVGQRGVLDDAAVDKGQRKIARIDC